MKLLYSEVKGLLEGYSHYIALMTGLDIKFKRNKRFNQFEYWIYLHTGEDLLLMTAEMGFVKNGIVTLIFEHANQFGMEFMDEYNSKPENFYPQFSHKVNSLHFTVYDIDQIKQVLDLFEKIGWFDR